MPSDDFRYCLFPYTTLSEKDLRHLSVFLPELSIMKIIRPAPVPKWAADRISEFSVLSDEELSHQVDLCLEGYRRLAEQHGAHGALASISLERDGVLKESRFRIQSELRGKMGQLSESRRVLILEAAVFLETARDLDEREMELEEGVRSVGKLEDEFQSILGISAGEESDEVSETLIPPLSAERTHLSFMLRKRIAFWLRLFANHRPSERPIPVALSEEVVDETIDPLQTKIERAGGKVGLDRITTASIPSLENLSEAAFQSLSAELRASGAADDFRRALEAALKSPEDAVCAEDIKSRADDLGRLIERFLRSEGLFGPKPERVFLYRRLVRDYSFADLWKYLDADGFEAWQGEDSGGPTPAILLSLG